MAPMGLMVLMLFIICRPACAVDSPPSPMNPEAYPQSMECRPVKSKRLENLQIRKDEQSGAITFLKSANLSASLEKDERFLALQRENRFTSIALCFLSAFRDDFLLKDPCGEMREESLLVDDLGLKHIRFQQVFKGVPVWAAALTVHLDRSNHVYLVAGRYIPTPSKVDIQPVIDEKQAVDKVKKEMALSAGQAVHFITHLCIFAPEGRDPGLAYQVTARLQTVEGWEMMVDARNGRILEKLTTTHNKAPSLK